MIFGLSLLPRVMSQTDAFEFSWPGDTDQCGVSTFSSFSWPSLTIADVRSFMDRWIATVQGILCVGHLTPSLPTADDTQTDRRRSDGIRYPRLCLYWDIGTLSSEPTFVKQDYGSETDCSGPAPICGRYAICGLHVGC